MIISGSVFLPTTELLYLTSVLIQRVTWVCCYHASSFKCFNCIVTYFVCVCVHPHLCLPGCTGGSSQRIILGVNPLPSTMWVLGTELRAWDMAAKVVMNFLYSWGGPWTHSPCAPAFWVLRLQVQLCLTYLRILSNISGESDARSSSHQSEFLTFHT